MDKLQDYFSRKFLLTVVVLIMAYFIPIKYKENGVSETVTMTVLVLLASVGAAYGFINVKDAKNQLQDTAKEIATKVDVQVESKS